MPLTRELSPNEEAAKFRFPENRNEAVESPGLKENLEWTTAVTTMAQSLGGKTEGYTQMDAYGVVIYPTWIPADKAAQFETFLDSNGFVGEEDEWSFPEAKQYKIDKANGKEILFRVGNDPEFKPKATEGNPVVH